MQRLLCLLASLSSLSLAQSLRGPTEVAAFVDAASREIRLYAPVLRSRPLAEALHRAIRERGVRVMIYTPYLRDPGSYFLGLSLAGAELYSVADVGTTGVLWMDGRYLIAGPLVGGLGDPLETAPTQVFQSPETLGRYRVWFDQLRPTAQAFLPSRDLLRVFPQLGR